MVVADEGSLESNQSEHSIQLSDTNSNDRSNTLVNLNVSDSSSKPKDNNPFTSGKFNKETTSVYDCTSIPKDELERYPFKTLNRILEDIKWTIPYKSFHGTSLLNSRPIDYSKKLCSLVEKSVNEYSMLIMNNHFNYSPTIETIEMEDQGVKLTIIRGLLIKFNEVNHFRLITLDHTSNPFLNNIIDKYEYHIVPRSRISIGDLALLKVVPDEEFIDDAFYRSMNGSTNQLLRVSLYKQEFTEDDLYPLVNQDLIKERYLQGVARHPNLNLSVDIIPNVTHCFKTLIRALKGPILLQEGESIKTISLNDTVLDSQVPIELLLNRLSFTKNESGSEVIPPSLCKSSSLRESYIRKVQELIYLGRIYGKSVQPNDFIINYSFSDNLSLVFRTFNEFDKHHSQAYFRNKDSNKLPFLINLSVCSFFQDELIIKCFENTVKSDIENKMLYVDSLKHIIEFRNDSRNNKLRSYYQNLSARGEMIGYSDYISAMRTLGISVDENNSNLVEDDVIIAMYQNSYKSDPKNYQYYNNTLRLIVKGRNSTSLNKFYNNELLPMSLAMDELNIEEITEDEVVITAYEFKLDDVLQANGFNPNSNEVKLLNKALLSVAVNRKSYLLMDYIEVKLPNILNSQVNLSFSQACEILGCSTTSPDFEVISNFQTKLVSDGSEDIRILRACFKVIAENKKSDILSSFIRTGRIDSSLLPTENWPAGLDNIGNTCYLNSLLQYYFCIKPLREMILTFNEFDIKSHDRDRKIGGRKVEESEIKRSYQFIYHLRNLFSEMIYTDKRCVQPSKELAYLSFLPLSQPVNFKESNESSAREASIGISDENPILISSQSPASNHDDDIEMIDPANPSSGIGSVYSSTGQLTSSTDSIKEITTPFRSQSPSPDNEEKENIPKVFPISTDQMESTIEVGRQQDVTECIENVTFQIETALESEYLEEDGEQFDMIKKLFYGKMKQTITPVDENSKQRVSIERFFSLIINVGDHPKDIYDSLDNYFNEDLVTLDEGLVRKSITISALPEVMQFHVQRVLFDRERLMAYKSLEPIPFSDTIYLDRYLDTEDEEILSKRNEVFKWKSEVKELNMEKDKILQIDEENKLSIIDSLIATKKFLESKIITHESLSINPSTIISIQEQIDLLKNKLQSINDQLIELQNKISSQFADYKEVGYSIFAIFIHRGEASYGHYWLYIKDPHKNIFRKYNDETVTEVPASEIFNFVEGNTATPYYIVYVKDSLMCDYIEPLKRVIEH